MIHNIPDNLTHMLVEVDDLQHLPGNPRKSDVDAIAKSYQEFGQLNPIVAVKSDDGSIIVLAGNHQLRAARDVLGWTHIAAAVHDTLSEEQALAFAALDNHWHVIGGIDDELQYELIRAADGAAAEVFDAVGWDDFAMAAMEDIVDTSMATATSSTGVGWEAPTIIVPDELASTPTPAFVKDDTPEQTSVMADVGTTDTDILTRGSGAVVASPSNVKIQYTMVFDSSAQQSQWYALLRFLKDSPVYEGETSATLISEFISAHTEL